MNRASLNFSLIPPFCEEQDAVAPRVTLRKSFELLEWHP
jgi:hypothetical protein